VMLPAWGKSRILGFGLFTTKAKKNIRVSRSLEDIWQQEWFNVPCFPSYNCEYLLIIADLSCQFYILLRSSHHYVICSLLFSLQSVRQTAHRLRETHYSFNLG
jgi:hypothetical protein